MSELTATVAETRANFSKIAATVSSTKQPVTVFRNSKPWVVIAPVSENHIPNIDWSKQDVISMDVKTRTTTLPADWDCAEDDGLYDDLA